MSGLQERCVAICQAINSLVDMQGASDLDKANYFQQVAEADSHTSENVAKFFGWKDILPPPGVPEPTEPPTLTSLNPVTAEVGAAEFTLECIGTNFSPSYSHINFNGGDEITTFIDATKVTTLVRPATASGAAEVPVKVRTLLGETEPQMFSFTAPAGLTQAMGYPDPAEAKPMEEVGGTDSPDEVRRSRRR